MGNEHPDLERRLAELERTSVRYDVFNERTQSIRGDLNEVKSEQRGHRNLLRSALLTGLVTLIVSLVVLYVSVSLRTP